jgi:hypothetical protein
MRTYQRLLQAAAAISLASATVAVLEIASAAPARAQDFTNSIVYLHDSTKCIDDYHSGTANYNNVDIYTCNYGAAQEWTFHDVGIAFGNPVYEIELASHPTKCLDDYHSGTANYNNVDLYDCNQSGAQRWVSVPISSTTFALENFNTLTTTGMCLDVYHAGTANYTNVDIYQCNSSNAQVFFYGS